MAEDKKFDKIENESGIFSTTFNRKYRDRKPWEPQDPGKIVAFMPGTVEQIKVREGEEVKKGDTLMVFRAMKMENQILAPFDGRVKKVVVSSGDNLPKNALMIELEYAKIGN